MSCSDPATEPCAAPMSRNSPVLLGTSISVSRGSLRAQPWRGVSSWWPRAQLLEPGQIPEQVGMWESPVCKK